MCTNYNDRESQISDNMSNGGVEDFAELFGGNKHAATGLISSLEAKGMGQMDDDGYDLFWLSEKGINTIFDIKDHEKE